MIIVLFIFMFDVTILNVMRGLILPMVLFCIHLFCGNGQDRFHFNIPQIERSTGEPITNKKVFANELYSYEVILRPVKLNQLHICRNLFQQYLFDM